LAFRVLQDAVLHFSVEEAAPRSSGRPTGVPLLPVRQGFGGIGRLERVDSCIEVDIFSSRVDVNMSLTVYVFVFTDAVYVFVDVSVCIQR